MNMQSAASVALAILLSGCHARPDSAILERRSRSAFAAVGPPDDRGTITPPSASAVLADGGLERYVAYGLHHSAELRGAFQKWRAALERIPQVASLPDPVFSFSQFIESIETRTGPQQRRYSIRQTFPWFGTLTARSEVATTEAEAIWHDVLAARLRLVRDIRIAFADYAYLAHTQRITADVLELLRQLEPVVQRRIAAGNGGQQDLLRLQVEVGRVENEQASLLQVRRSMSARLAAAMNLRTGELLPFPEVNGTTGPEGTDPGMPLDVDRLIDRAERENPEVQGLRQRVLGAGHRQDVAELSTWPDITLGVDYIETDEARAPVAGSGDDPVALGVSMSLPIWGGRNRAVRREAEFDLAAARHALEARRADLRAEIEHAAFEVGDADRQRDLYRETLLPRAREALDVTRAAYRAGSAPLLELIDSERALLELETGYWRATRDLNQSRARLDALVGGSLQ